ncbi:hypothetical protein TL18_05150 [Methanobrevibacter sp. YE315]|uniref:hypothetical protein n=1 Tax=Methanobrevibacter sp. YE315 TaxID=1609968 RepID=UPI000764D664|nr:hypothetical protein [Methanobrevibacter sp. YE315]AMD17458.1 hypothetical protein TL18_05150 [Methanobrevibacter sp. YE315]
MSNENSRIQEIRRLTTPFTFKNSKAYDSDGNLIKCVEKLSDIRFPIEPKEGILTDDEILKYAADSKAASKIRLERGAGSISDVFTINDFLPWYLGLYYILVICFAIPFIYWGNKLVMFIFLILSILPLIYLYKITNSTSYIKTKAKPIVDNPVHTDSTRKKIEIEGLESLKKYEKEINNLNVLFDVKEEVVRKLIEKRFSPPQITYDRFISIIDSCHKLFYSQSDAALNIIHLAAEDTPRVEDELQKKINTMKTIINQIEDLTNELVININSDEESKEDVKSLLDEMESLIDSVKEY